MPDWIAVICLGIIEGITEFLPISSTGHLLIAEQWLPRQSDLFNTLVQSGAVLSVLVVFKERVKRLVFQRHDKASKDFLIKLASAFLITAAGGLILKATDFKLPETTVPVAWATLIGGVLFLAIERWLRGRPLSGTITWNAAVVAGAAQLLAAIFPGTSRSGATILLLLLLGLNRPAAIEFSFLLGVPTLLAAGVLQFYSALRIPGGCNEQWGLVILSTAVSTVMAFVAVKWLLRFVQSHTFEGFGWYRIGLGILILILVS